MVWIFLVYAAMASWLQALAIETTTDIFLRKQKSGHFSGVVLYKNTPQKHLIVKGTYNIAGNTLTLKATQLKRLPLKKYSKSQIYPLSQVQASEQLGSILPSKISKGTHIYFKELGTQKVSSILGMGDLNSYSNSKTSHFTSSAHRVTRFSTDPTKITRNQQSPQTQTTLTESNTRFSKPSSLATLSTKSTPTSRRTRTSSASKTSSTRARSARTGTTSRTTSRSTTKRTSKTSSRSTKTSSNQNYHNTSPAPQDSQPYTSNSTNSQDLTISNLSDPNQPSYVYPDDNLLPMPIVQNQTPTQTTTPSNASISKQLETQNTPIDLDSTNDDTQEVACGYWTYEDDKLQAIRPTLVRRLDRTSGQYLDISPCNFDSTHGKSGKIILAYTQLPDQIQEFAPVKTTHTFTLSKANYSEKLCYRARTRQCLYIEPNSVQEWTSTYLTTTIRTTKTYKRPPQVGSDTSTEYKQILDENKAERSTVINKDDLHLSPQFMEFVEVYEGKYLDSNTANAPEYLAWKEKVVRPNQGTCSQYAIEELSRNKNVLPSIHNTKIVCVKSGDYLLDQNTP
ncbi:hypothetical protein [Helicobacter suis]|uniref:hypothetical protein n=1 Tax=Helicobacter suis TaxID=104628 RepID=UPI0013D25C90|nr:hypothetical protein [Helicobacter suis]BCD48728.1 hypothetical protein NHP194004_01750 [Helicobacter suis]